MRSTSSPMPGRAGPCKNVGHSGKFSSDRTIAQYASEIWRQAMAVIAASDVNEERSFLMAIHPLAGQLAPASVLDRRPGARAGLSRQPARSGRSAAARRLRHQRAPGHVAG